MGRLRAQVLAVEVTNRVRCGGRLPFGCSNLIRARAGRHPTPLADVKHIDFPGKTVFSPSVAVILKMTPLTDPNCQQHEAQNDSGGERAKESHHRITSAGGDGRQAFVTISAIDRLPNWDPSLVLPMTSDILSPKSEHAAVPHTGRRLRNIQRHPLAEPGARALEEYAS